MVVPREVDYRHVEADFDCANVASPLAAEVVAEAGGFLSRLMGDLNRNLRLRV